MALSPRRLLFCVAAVVCISACGSAAPTSVETPTSTPTTSLAPGSKPPQTPALTPEPASYWPTEGWHASTPEEQGVDSALLVKMLQSIQKESVNIDSVSIVRNGYLIADVYFFPTNQGTMHIIHSVTKSVVSTLIGIAIEKGYIESVDRPVLELFADKTIANVDAKKESMTLEHLLTMSSGLECRDSYLYNWRGLAEMRASEDWAQHMLSLPMAEAPGARFEYCNGVSYLLSAIVQQSSAMTSLEFAHQHLFGPLGITDVEWPASPQGVNIGWGTMLLTPHDMLKLGYLYLNQGRWEDQQVVPAHWVSAATTSQIRSGTLSDAYGYQWWVDDAGFYVAIGYGGQFIFVVPDRDLVVVFTSGIGRDFPVPERLLRELIIPAAASSEPLPENPEGAAQFRELAELSANPPPKPVPPLPKTAQEVSGRTYVLNDNTLGFKRLSLEFSGDEALFKLSYRNKNIEVRVGLDGVHRITHAAGYQRAYKGSWTSDNTFVMSYEIVGYVENGTLELTFDRDQLTVLYQEETEGTSETMIGRPE